VTATAEDFPRRIEDLTVEWLGAHVGDGDLLDFDVEPIAAGVGMIGSLARLWLHWSEPEAGPASVVVKVAASTPATRNLVALFNFYGKEIGFYRRLAARTPARTPRCHGAYFDPDAQEFILLLEDGGAGSLVDQIQGCTGEQVGMVLDELSALHAAWWQSAELDEIPWLQRLGDPLYTTGIPIGLQQTWPHTSGILAETVPGWFLKRWDDFQAAVPGLLYRLDAMPRTLAHGDTRLDNLVFGVGDAPVMLLDWQIVLHAPGIYDVAYFMSQSVPVELRRTVESDALQSYRRRLLDRGVPAPSTEELWDGYRIACLYCVVYPIIGGGPADPTDRRAVQLLRTVAERCFTAIDDVGAIDLL
jgi:Phosphotransferase enzyme family